MPKKLYETTVHIKILLIIELSKWDITVKELILTINTNATLVWSKELQEVKNWCWMFVIYST